MKIKSGQTFEVDGETFIAKSSARPGRQIMAQGEDGRVVSFTLPADVALPGDDEREFPPSPDDHRAKPEPQAEPEPEPTHPITPADGGPRTAVAMEQPENGRKAPSLGHVCQCEPVGTVEIAERYGVAEQTVRAWRYRKVMPLEKWTIGGRPVWCQHELDVWAIQTNRWRNLMGDPGLHSSQAKSK